MTDNQQACTESRYEVSRKDLPLSCPMPPMMTWNAHPRVFLDIETNGEVSCPYCGAHYVLRD
ncbi:MAG: zinc-finger domain-containing protein [Gammaproteobacteria bacterium]|nr:zinc-finger domain-containing protein [Gammaproteobacteria bacterium]MDH5591240.1 zinc-finger domain-containing protein [Gammaproteobacteria bacterium]